MNAKRTETIQALNVLLQTELAAVESYNQALALMATSSPAWMDLQQCQVSHQNRVLRLRSEILELGGEPLHPRDVVFGGARPVTSTRAGAPRTFECALGALAATERKGLTEYMEILPRLEFSSRNVVSVDIYPQQISTHSLLSAMSHAHA